jgi:hypothetical protein
MEKMEIVLEASIFNLDIGHVSSITVCEESARGFVGSRLGS